MLIVEGVLYLIVGVFFVGFDLGWVLIVLFMVFFVYLWDDGINYIVVVWLVFGVIVDSLVVEVNICLYVFYVE